MNFKYQCAGLALLFITLMMVIPVSALTTSATDFGTFKQATSIDLLQTCDNGVTMCTACNISSVKNPNSTSVLSNVEMTKRSYDFNYTLGSDKTTSLGTYLVSGYCADATSVKNWYYQFTITPAGGAENNTLVFLMLSVTALIILVLAFLFHNHIFSIVSGMLFLGSGVYAMVYGFGAIANDYTRILAVVICGFGAIILLASILELIKEASEGTPLSFAGGYGGDDDDE